MTGCGRQWILKLWLFTDQNDRCESEINIQTFATAISCMLNMGIPPADKKTSESILDSPAENEVLG